MDQPSPKRRFRFGLRTLLILVAVCATVVGVYCYRLRLLPYEVQQVYAGMTPAEALDVLGKPINFRGELRPGFRFNDPKKLGDYWIWQFEWGQIDMRFDQQDRCCLIEYFVELEGWHTLVDRPASK